MRRRLACGGRLVDNVLIGLVCAVGWAVPITASAQDPRPLPESATEPRGVVAEPVPITRAVLFADRHFGKEDVNNGFYVDFANMIPGAGWLSAGPGYHHWYARDRVFVDASAGYSWNRYQTAQARIELPRLLRSRVALGTELHWANYRHVDYFGEGPGTVESAGTEYGIRGTHLAGHATLRLVQPLAIRAQIGWLNATTRQVEGLPLPAAPDQRTFVPILTSITLDTRDFPDHTMRGSLLRAAASRYDDRDGGAFTFNRYETEVAGFIPVSDDRLVVALRGWLVASDSDEGRSVPFYLQPSLGGGNTLRSYTDYRFHDRHMLVTNAELRVALTTHLETAFFVDAGNVASRVRDLDLAKRSYGLGLRLHTRRATFARIDFAQGEEGWRAFFSLRDPLRLSRLNRRAEVVPFVP